MQEFFHIVLHGLLDSLKLLPFLYLTYLLMELLEHKAGERVEAGIAKAGKAGPLLGGLLGLVPQCGFSAAAAGLYAGGLVTPGTLLAVFLATSDEMLPIFLGEGIAAAKILTVLGIKLAVALTVGFAVDLLLRRRRREPCVGEICNEEHCHCEEGIWRSALHHTLQVFVFVLIVNLVLGGVFELVGEERLALLLRDLPVVGVLSATLVGLVPNCSASVLIATLWAKGVISGGAMLGGLLTGAGAGLLVLFRSNRHLKENLFLTLFLFLAGLGFGLLLDLTGLAALLGL